MTSFTVEMDVLKVAIFRKNKHLSNWQATADLAGRW